MTFVVGLALLGELAGSVGEPDAWFIQHFNSGTERTEDIVGSFLLVASAIALLTFTRLVAAGARVRSGETMGELAQAAGVLTSFGILLAALSFLTVPLSISIGELYDDSAFIEGRATVPQFGYVALTVGAMFPAAVMVIAIARLQVHPVWLTRLSYLIAAMLLTASFAVSPMFILLPGWVALTLANSSRPAHDPRTEAS